MTTDAAQANTQAASAAAAGSADAAPKPNRHDEYFASLGDPTEMAEFVKRGRKVFEPDFQKQDAAHQRRFNTEKKRADDAERQRAELADPEVLSRYQQEQGSLAKAIERAKRNGVPDYMVRRARSFEDIWDAEDDWTKNKTVAANGPAATETSASSEDLSAHIKALQTAGYVTVPPKGATTTGFTQAPARGGSPASVGQVTSDNIDAMHLAGAVTDAAYRLFLRTGQLP